MLSVILLAKLRLKLTTYKDRALQNCCIWSAIHWNRMVVGAIFCKYGRKNGEKGAF